MKRAFLIVAALVLALAGCLAGYKFYRRSLLSGAIAHAEPLPHSDRLKGIPVLLLHGEADTVVPIALHSEQLKSRLGASCTLIRIPGAGHGAAACKAPEPICSFIKKHSTAADTVIFIHGATRPASAWNVPFSHDVNDTSRVLLTQRIRGLRSIYTADFGGDLWGDDKALALLEQAASHYSRVVLVGESMGGLLMLRYAERHPEKVSCIVGINPVCAIAPMRSTWLQNSVEAAYR